MVRGYVALLGTVIILILVALAVWNFTWIINKILELRARRKELPHRPSDRGNCDYCRHRIEEEDHEHVVKNNILYHLHKDCKAVFEKVK